MIAVIDNYDSFTWNLVQYICELGAEVEVSATTRSRWRSLAAETAGLVISPGPGGRPTPGSPRRDPAFETRSRFSGLPGASVRREGIRDGLSTPSAHAREDLRVRHNGKGSSRWSKPMIATRYHSLAVERGPFLRTGICAEAEDAR